MPGRAHATPGIWPVGEARGSGREAPPCPAGPPSDEFVIERAIEQAARAMRAKSTLSSLLIRPTSSGLRSRLLTRRLILSRGCTWPVPIDRDDDAYFAPLESLLLHEGTELYLGLIHREDGARSAHRDGKASRGPIWCRDGVWLRTGARERDRAPPADARCGFLGVVNR